MEDLGFVGGHGPNPLLGSIRILSAKQTRANGRKEIVSEGGGKEGRAFVTQCLRYLDKEKKERTNGRGGGICG